MSNGRWDAKKSAKADYEGEVLNERADEYVLDHLEEFVSENREAIVEILLEEHFKFLKREMAMEALHERFGKLRREDD